MEQTISYSQLIKDYNKFYGTEVAIITTDTHYVEKIFEDIYNADGFELNEDEETITLYFD